MRITPDTGILVRMNVKATGPARRLLETILTGPHEPVLSEFLLTETAGIAVSEGRFPKLLKILKADHTGWSRWKERFFAKGRCADSFKSQVGRHQT